MHKRRGKPVQSRSLNEKCKREHQCQTEKSKILCYFQFVLHSTTYACTRLLDLPYWLLFVFIRMSFIFEALFFSFFVLSLSHTQWIQFNILKITANLTVFHSHFAMRTVVWLLVSTFTCLLLLLLLLLFFFFNAVVLFVLCESYKISVTMFSPSLALSFSLQVHEIIYTAFTYLELFNVLSPEMQNK